MCRAFSPPQVFGRGFCNLTVAAITCRSIAPVQVGVPILYRGGLPNESRAPHYHAVLRRRGLVQTRWGRGGFWGDMSGLEVRSPRWGLGIFGGRFPGVPVGHHLAIDVGPVGAGTRRERRR